MRFSKRFLNNHKIFNEFRIIFFGAILINSYSCQTLFDESFNVLNIFRASLSDEHDSYLCQSSIEDIADRFISGEFI